jgi:hypothetical protein
VVDEFVTPCAQGHQVLRCGRAAGEDVVHAELVRIPPGPSSEPIGGESTEPARPAVPRDYLIADLIGDRLIRVAVIADPGDFSCQREEEVVVEAHRAPPLPRSEGAQAAFERGPL